MAKRPRKPLLNTPFSEVDAEATLAKQTVKRRHPMVGRFAVFSHVAIIRNAGVSVCNLWYSKGRLGLTDRQI
jgi:hypothetical protein